MKLEIIKEEKFNEPTWYFFKVDGITYQCSKDLKEMISMKAISKQILVGMVL
jgi:hypothetical protein